MNWPRSLSHYILGNTREVIYWRGVDYAREGKVGRLNQDGNILTGVAAGSQLYEVAFRKGTKHVNPSCSCPYAQANEDYCKHIVAIAVAWDISQSIELPSEKEVSAATVVVDYSFGNNIRALYDDPLNADLQLLASASDSGSWVRTHSKLMIRSTLSQDYRPLTVAELERGFQAVAKLENLRNYDHYFCAGEVSAILSLTYDTILARLKLSPLDVAQTIVVRSIVFYYDTYLQMIDGSDGVWQIPQARLLAMIEILREMGLTEETFTEMRTTLNKLIDGWGDIYKDLGIAPSKG